MRGWLPLCLVGALCAPLRASAADGDDRRSIETKPACPPGTPGYECMSRRALWKAAVRFEGKLVDERLAHSQTKLKLAGANQKLATRTSTTIRKLVPTPATAEGEAGHSTTTILLVGGLAVVLGIVVGFLAAPRSQPGAIVVK